eukprot:CAMPEP_0119319710 /NCGR_PEP_ID=MMETSP1333-20130426/50138_1 /TAXON_ID=418940 /ORGANISM="Scyphosphaera apsteinii, Strain RCC1455" /LENGTH=92 /DNA_ID=CAMNT_0007326187 /DNA_START=558 /DNA_END=835 /DNA_ORIENTATION=+
MGAVPASGGLPADAANNEEVSQRDDAERPERLKDKARELPVGREYDEQPEALRHERDKEESLGNAAGVLESTGSQHGAWQQREPYGSGASPR